MQTVIVIVMTTISRFSVLAAGAILAAPFGLAACAGGDDQAAPTAGNGECPTTPINVVVSVDQWGDIVSELGGECAKVTTVLASSAVDPHDYEPSPSDAAAFQDAQLVVINGGHYDEWAAKLASTSAPNAPVIDALELGGGEAGHEGEEQGHGGEEQGHEGHEGEEHG